MISVAVHEKHLSPFSEWVSSQNRCDILRLFSKKYNQDNKQFQNSHFYRQKLLRTFAMVFLDWIKWAG